MSLWRGFVRSDRRILVAIAIGLLVAPAILALVVAAPPDAGVGVAAARVVEPGADGDADGLADIDEVRRWGTNPASRDTDLDGLDDAWETRWSRAVPGTTRACPDPLRADATRDCAGKGVTLAEDRRAGTDPTTRDTDGDGIDDAVELRLAMDPFADDADADPFGNGLTHRTRALLGARADRYDTACSGISDAEKAKRGLDPTRASTGGSGVPDGWALHFGLDPADPLLGARKLDGDPLGLTVLEKATYSAKALDLCATPDAAPPFARGLDPRRSDADADGMPDAWELRHGRDPLDAANARADPDGDGLTDLEEFALAACPGTADCDGDGLTDAQEAREGWNVTLDGATRRVVSVPTRTVSDGDRIPDDAKRRGAWTVGGRMIRFAPLDPATPDTDADDLSDADEILRFAGALRPDTKDSDADGLSDGEEVAYWDARGAEHCAACDGDGDGAPNAADADADGDTLTDGDELRPRLQATSPGAASRAAFPPSDPARADSDADGLPDAWEKRHARFDPIAGEWDMDPTRAGDGERDPDADGMPNARELVVGTDPHDDDSDDDGLPDGWEDRFGSGAGARAGGVLAGRGFEWLLAPGDPIALSPLDGDDASRTIARYDGVRYQRGARVELRAEWSHLDLWRANATPTKPASGSDGIPDLYKALWMGEAPDAFDGPDADGDGRSNRDEYVAGTDPLARDTDGGGLDDLAEATAGLDPLEPGDDAGEGDLDSDGLSNAAELALWRTRVDSPDTDADGLLDGGDVVLARTSAVAARFRSLGVAHRAEGEALRFYGEARVSTDPAAGCALAWSCAGDGLPDAWKAWYEIGAGSYHPPSEVRSGDGLAIALEYAWGRPAWWSEPTHGPWWLGLDPTRADTHRDGIRDDLQTRVDAVADLDRDGLNDLSGEDPAPFYGDVDVRDRAAAFAALQARVLAPAIAPAPRAAIALAGALPAEAAKGGAFRVEGRVEPAAEGVVVLARLVPGDVADARTSRPELVHAAALTRADGTFTLVVSTARTHALELPRDAAVFGASASGTLAWEADTSRIVVGQPHRLVVWSHAHAGVGSGLLAPDATISLGSAARLGISGELGGAPGSFVRVNATLQDGAGDARPIASADAIRIAWADATLAPASVDGANATFVLSIPSDATATPLPARISYAGDAILAPGSTDLLVLPRLDVALVLDALPRNATLGETLAIRGALADERGSPVAGANVTVRFAGASANATTDRAGRLEARVTVPPGATLGSRAPVVAFEGSAHHEAASATGTAVSVKARPIVVDLAASATLGRIEVRGRLLAAGRPVVDPTLDGPPTVHVSVAGLVREATPSADGSFRALLSGSAVSKPGLYDVVVAANGTPLVDPARSSLRVVLDGETRLTLDAARGARGDAASARGTLRDATGAPLVNAEVVLQAAGARVAARTDARGSFAARVPLEASLPVGPMSLTASFAGIDGIHRPSSAAAQLVVLSATRMNVSRAVVEAIDAAVTLTLVDDAGRPRAGEPVAILVDDQGGATLVTDGDGAARLTLPDAALVAPSVLVRARTAEGPLHAAFDGVERVFIEQPTSIAFLEPAPEVAPGATIALRVRLTTALGAALPGADVDVVLGERNLATLATVGAIATGEIVVPADAPLGPSTLRARFAGSGRFLPSSAETPVSVRAPSRLDVAWEGDTLRVRVLGEDAMRIAGAEIVVEAGAAVLLVRADAAGEARVSFPHVDAPIAFRFLGNDERLPSSATAAAGSAAAEGSPPSADRLSYALAAALALGVAGVGIAAWLYTRYRRRAATDVELALRGAERAFRARDEHGAAVVLAYRTLVGALSKRGLARESATPRETQVALAAAFRLPGRDLEVVIEAFELARYGDGSVSADLARGAADALHRIRDALREMAA